MKFPTCSRVQFRRYHHHTFSYLRPFYLFKSKRRSLSTSNFWYRHPVNWKYIKDFSNCFVFHLHPTIARLFWLIKCYLFRWIDLIAIGWKWPSASGPIIRVSFSLIIPRNSVPLTTVPTPNIKYNNQTKTWVKEGQQIYSFTLHSMVRMYIPGTEYVSSIWNSAGLSSVFGDRELRRFINIFNRSRFSPVTFDTCDSKNDKIILACSKLPK